MKKGKEPDSQRPRDSPFRELEEFTIGDTGQMVGNEAKEGSKYAFKESS